MDEHPLDSPVTQITVDKYPSYKPKYKLALDKCSNCHNISRAFNSNYIGKQWEKIISKMILKSSSKMSSDEGKIINDFFNFYSIEKNKNPNNFIDPNNKSTIKIIDLNVMKVLESSEYLVSKYNGKILYQNYCSTCHGENGEGETGLRLNNTELIGIYLRDNAKFYRETIKMGRRGTLMKGWSYEFLGIFNNIQIENIIEFIKYEWYKKQIGNIKPTEYQIYPELATSTISEGKALFDNICASCHNGLYSDKSIPDIRNYTFIGTDSQGEPLTIDLGQLRYIIKNGRSLTGMFPFGKEKNGILELTNSQIDSIIKYIRSEPVIYK